MPMKEQEISDESPEDFLTGLGKRLSEKPGGVAKLANRSPPTTAT
jgi:hypothetical protein